jgi:hypothetical protein
VTIQAQLLSFLSIDTNTLGLVIVTNATRHTTLPAVQSYAENVCSRFFSVLANMAATSVKVKHLLTVSFVKNQNVNREKRSAESAKREKKCLEL